MIPSVLSVPAVTHYASVLGPPADKSSAWSSISVQWPNMWNDISADINCVISKSKFTFRKVYKALLLQPYPFCLTCVLLVCNDYVTG